MHKAPQEIEACTTFLKVRQVCCIHTYAAMYGYLHMLCETHNALFMHVHMPMMQTAHVYKEMCLCFRLVMSIAA